MADGFDLTDWPHVGLTRFESTEQDAGRHEADHDLIAEALNQMRHIQWGTTGTFTPGANGLTYFNWPQAYSVAPTAVILRHFRASTSWWYGAQIVNWDTTQWRGRSWSNPGSSFGWNTTNSVEWYWFALGGTLA